MVLVEEPFDVADARGGGAEGARFRVALGARDQPAIGKQALFGEDMGQLRLLAQHR